MKKGFILTTSNKHYFFETTNTRKTKKIILDFIKKLCIYQNKTPDFIERVLNHEPTIKDFIYRIDLATIENRTTDNGTNYTNISGKYFSECLPDEEAKTTIIFL